MVVIADSSPLHYLILIDAAGLLCELFGEVTIPTSVYAELQSLSAPPKVNAWLSTPPEWLRIEKVPLTAHGGLEQLGEGERDAIVLALAAGQDALLLIDERKGRQAAEVQNIRFMGTLGVLDKAALLDLIDLPSAIERLLQTNIRLSPGLLKKLLDEDARRRSTGS